MSDAAGNRGSMPSVLPTPAQIAWADAEVGVIIHLDMQVFEAGYEFRRRWGYTPDPSVFNPPELDTDQWLAAARSAGATYAVLVAKHCSGFSLWPTRAHDYSVASSPWKGGKGDVVADFMASCRKYGLKPGLYASASVNAHLRVDNPGRVLTDDAEFLRRYSASTEMQSGRQSVWAQRKEQERYNRVVETQLAELWSDYGPLFEIWFDGGVLGPEQGGPDVVPIMRRLQPDAVVFGGPPGWPSLARYVGNERGEVPDPFWSTLDDLEAFDGTIEIAGLGGSPDGRVWAGGEAAMPNRCQIRAFQGGWFWRAGDESWLYSTDHLVERYFSSVGRNANLLLGMVVDPRGRVPEADCAQFAEFGARIARMHADPVARVEGEGASLSMPLPAGRRPTLLALMEDLRHGHRVRRFVVEASTDGGWVEIWRGSAIGHKILQRFSPIDARELRLRVLESAGEPHIRAFAAWAADPALFSVPMDLALRATVGIRRDRDGLVRLVCSDPGLAIRYTCDGSEPGRDSPVYAQPIPLRGGGTVKAAAFINDGSQSPVASAVFGVDRSGWRVVSVSLDSPFRNEGHAGVAHLLDDDTGTYWHTYHSDKRLSAAPHHVVLDMGRTLEVTGFTVLPRGPVGAPDACRFELSLDGEHWTVATEATLTGLATDHSMRLIALAGAMPGRFLRFTVLHVHQDVDFVAVAGLGVTALPPA